MGSLYQTCAKGTAEAAHSLRSSNYMNPGEKTRVRAFVNTSPLMSWVSWGALSCFCSAPRQQRSPFGVTIPALLPLVLLAPEATLKLFVRTKPPRSPLRNESMRFLGPVHAGHCRPHPSLLPPALQPAAGWWQGVRRKAGSEAAPQPLAFEAGGSPSPLQPPPPPFWAEKK